MRTLIRGGWVVGYADGQHHVIRDGVCVVEDDRVLRKAGIVRTIYDPACGTGGMLSVSEKYIHDLNADAQPKLFGRVACRRALTSSTGRVRGGRRCPRSTADMTSSWPTRAREEQRYHR